MTLDLAQPAMLADVTRLVTRLQALRRGEEFRAAGLVVPCELATHVNLLDWLGIPVTLVHQLEHQRLADEAVRAAPERFAHLTGARWLDAYLADARNAG